MKHLVYQLRFEGLFFFKETNIVLTLETTFCFVKQSEETKMFQLFKKCRWFLSKCSQHRFE